MALSTSRHKSARSGFGRRQRAAGSTMAIRHVTVLRDRYNLSHINMRDGIVLQTEVDDQCDKLAIDRCKYCQVS